jgi:hypothetical protein
MESVDEWPDVVNEPLAAPEARQRMPDLEHELLEQFAAVVDVDGAYERTRVRAADKQPTDTGDRVREARAAVMGAALRRTP